MNKKERKAEAILKAAQVIASKKVDLDSASVVKIKVVDSKDGVVRPKYSVPPMEFPEGRYGKYDAFEIIKEKKGCWRVRMQEYARGFVENVERRFKSWYSARVWCLLHRNGQDGK